jgi:hypothetical protein
MAPRATPVTTFTATQTTMLTSPFPIDKAQPLACCKCGTGGQIYYVVQDDEMLLQCEKCTRFTLRQMGAFM